MTSAIVTRAQQDGRLMPHRHAGGTSPVPAGVLPAETLKWFALSEFEAYAAQRPQVAFGEPEIEIVRDEQRCTERAVWSVRSRIRWS